MPTISVVIPVYNVEKYLNTCIESVIAQTFSDFDLILIDDGSTDNCPEMCEEYADKDSRVHVIHQKNRGLSAARNAGIDWVFENSESEWITFVDSDDWIHPKTIELLYNASVHQKTNVSLCNYVRTTGKEPTINDVVDAQLWRPEALYTTHNTVSNIACAKLYRKKCFKDIRYPVGKIHEDEFTTYRILFRENEVSFINAPLYFYRVNPEGITESRWNIKRLDAISALAMQNEYFQKNSFPEAQKYARNSLFYCVDITRKKINSLTSKEKKFAYKKYVKELRKVIKKHRKIFPIKDNYWLYEIAFPGFMFLYWRYIAIIKRFKRC